MKSLKTKLLWLLMGALAVSAGTAMYALVMPGSGSFRWELFGSAMSLVAYSLGWMACARVGAQRSMRWLAITAGALLTLGYAGVLTLIWDVWGWPASDMAAKITATPTIIGITLVATGLLVMVSTRQRTVRCVRLSTIALGIVYSLLALALTWDMLGFDFNDILARLFYGLLILTAVGVLATIVLSRIEAVKLAEVAETGLPALIRITLTCPRCDLQQELPSGGSVCKGCGLAITIEVAEPVCAECGYSLAGLTGAECPECGVEISTDVLRLAGRTRKAE